MRTGAEREEVGYSRFASVHLRTSDSVSCMHLYSLIKLDLVRGTVFMEATLNSRMKRYVLCCLVDIGQALVHTHNVSEG